LRRRLSSYLYIVVVVAVVLFSIYLFMNNLVAPRVSEASISSASVILTPRGYYLLLNVSAASQTRLLSIEMGDIFVEYPYDVSPPLTTIEIPLPKRPPTSSGKVVFEGSIASFTASIPPAETRIVAAYDPRSGLAALAGYSPSSLTIYAFPTAKKVLVIPQKETSLGGGLLGRIEVKIAKPEMLREISDFEGYDAYLFVDIYPSPRLIEALKEKGLVILNPISTVVGEIRLEVDDSGAIHARRYGADVADIDYFGLHCWRASLQRYINLPPLENFPATEINSIVPLSEAHGYIVQSPSCLANVLYRIAVDSDGNPVAFYTGKYVVSSLDPTPSLILSIMMPWTGKIYRVTIEPFAGYRLLGDIFYRAIAITDLKNYWIVSGDAPYNYSVARGVSMESRSSINANVTVFSRLGAVVGYRSISMPSHSVTYLDPGYIYVLTTGDNNYLVIGMERAELGSITVYSAGTCEAGSVEIIREGGYGTLYLYISGKPVSSIEPGSKLSLQICGRELLEVKDGYGYILYYTVAGLPHFYETPQFVITAVLATIVGMGLASQKIASRKRGRTIPLIVREAQAIKQIAPSTFMQSDISDAVYLLEMLERRAPTMKEFLARYRVEPAEAFRNFLASIEKGSCTVYGEYVKEVGDMITVAVSRKSGGNVYKEIVKNIVSRISERYGINIQYGLGPCDIVLEKNKRLLCLIAAHDQNLISTPKGSREKGYIERVFSSMRYLEAFAEKIGGSASGVAVIAISQELADNIRSILMKLVTAADRDTSNMASAIMVDIENYIEIKQKYGSKILNVKILTALPYKHIVPLVILYLAGKHEICNKYYMYVKIG